MSWCLDSNNIVFKRDGVSPTIFYFLCGLFGFYWVHNINKKFSFVLSKIWFEPIFSRFLGGLRLAKRGDDFKFFFACQP